MVCDIHDVLRRNARMAINSPTSIWFQGVLFNTVPDKLVFSNLTENVIQKHFYSAKADELLILFDEQDNSQSWKWWWNRVNMGKGWTVRGDYLITFDGYLVSDTDNFSFSHHCGIGNFRKFVSISHTISPADFYDTWRNDSRWQENESTF